MKNTFKWIVTSYCLMPLSCVLALQAFTAQEDLSKKSQDPLTHDFRFDSSKLLQMNTTPLLSSNLIFKASSSQEKAKANQGPSTGFFLYKLQTPTALWSLPSKSLMESASSIQSSSSSSIYAHLFQRLMTHLFVDLAGGYEPNSRSNAANFLNVQHYRYDNTNNSYSKNWFASASALFTHTWKEFAFNANLGLTHAEANQDPYHLYFAQTMSPDLIPSLQNKVSFLHENAELSYRANSLFQPFVKGGLLQVMNPNTSTSSVLNLSLPTSLDPKLENNAYQLGGGLSLNYKQYVLRLEQQYFQRGSLYHSNQSIVSFQMNLG